LRNKKESHTVKSDVKLIEIISHQLKISLNGLSYKIESLK